LPTTADLPLTLDETLRTFESLSLNFKANVAKLASVGPSEQPLSSTDEEEVQVYRVMTKAQNQLTTDEGKVWEEIASSMSMYAKPAVSTASLDFPTSTIDDIHTLADKSFVMSTSFLRRTHLPTDQTYRESKEILQAMGIRCIDATDAIEAEALASAIVHKGLADFVVTEDTVRKQHLIDNLSSRILLVFFSLMKDVLVYEVPMIKNITNRVEPLVVVSGAEVRAELNLDRDAYIDFALLLGTDFSQRIANVGPARAYKFIKNHGSIERIIELETKYEPKLPLEDYLAEVELGRLAFKTLPTVPLSKLKRTPKKDDKKVTKVLQRHGLSRELVDAGNFETLLDGNYFRDSPTA
jgi:flap endonuclease-1